LEAINATAFSELAKRQAEARAAETRHLHEMLEEHDVAEAAVVEGIRKRSDQESCH